MQTFMEAIIKHCEAIFGLETKTTDKSFDMQRQTASGTIKEGSGTSVLMMYNDEIVSRSLLWLKILH